MRNQTGDEIRAYHRAWCERNKARIQKYQRAWKQRNPVKVREYYRKYMRQFRADNPDLERKRQRASSLKKNYGISIQEYDDLLKRQRGACAVCKKEPVKRRLDVDHDHKTGRIRGLLCPNCNNGLGRFFATLQAVSEDCVNIAAIETKIISLFEDSDSAKRPAVVCSSVHKAKGLEWNKVCLIEDTFKNRTAGEESNIYYVAVTRTKRTLVRAFGKF